MKEDEKEKKGKNSSVFIYRSELFDMQQAIRLMNGILSSELGDYRAKLRRQIDAAIDDMRDFMNTDEWKRVSKLFADIDLECASLDPAGIPKREPNGTIIINTALIPKREELLEKLKEKEKKAITDRDAAWQKYLESFNERIDISYFVRIPNSLFPKETPTEVKDWLWPIINTSK